MLYNELKNIEHLGCSAFRGLIHIYKYLAPMELNFTLIILIKNSVKSAIFVETSNPPHKTNSVGVQYS